MMEKKQRSYWQPVLKNLLSLHPTSWLAARLLHHIDRAVYKLSSGRFSATSALGGVPMIELTTVGAKTGLVRTVPLMGIPDGRDIILIASNWGQERHPGWYYNLLANPQVEVISDGKARTYLARTAIGEERQAGWNKALAVYSGYAAYESRSGEREIPVVVLTPVDPPTQ